LAYAFEPHGLPVTHKAGSKRRRNGSPALGRGISRTTTYNAQLYNPFRIDLC
jgi:hypothetical protein